jgi:hypothetical protein
MNEPSHEGRQIAVHLVLGFIPILKCRISLPSQYGGWEWGRWRIARFGEVVPINKALMNLWRD